MGHIDVSIIIPVFNGTSFLEEKLAAVAAWVNGAARPIEVIIVNDGSTDHTAEVLNSFKSAMPHYQVVTLPVNRGKGFALREGIKRSLGEYVGFTDADLPYGLMVFNYMLELMACDSKLDFVFGSRTHPQSKTKQGYGFLRTCGRLFFSIAVTLFTVPDVKDTQCGVKMLRRGFAMLMLEKAKVDRFAFDIELFAIARQNHKIYKSVPVELTHRKESSVHLVTDTLYMMYDIFKIRLRMWQCYYVRN